MHTYIHGAHILKSLNPNPPTGGTTDNSNVGGKILPLTHKSRQKDDKMPGKILPICNERLQKLTAGACKLLIAYWLDPYAGTAHYQAVTGYRERQMRNLYKELREAGLMEVEPTSEAALTDEQQRGYRRLVEFQFDRATARRLAIGYSYAVINAGINYTTGCEKLLNPRGFLIAWLKSNAGLASEYAGNEHANSPYAAYERLWQDDENENASGVAAGDR